MQYEILRTYLFLNRLFLCVISNEAAEIHWLMANMSPLVKDLRDNIVDHIVIQSIGILAQAIDTT